MPARTINSPRKTPKRTPRTPPHVPIKGLRLAAGWTLEELANRLAEHTGRPPGRGTLCAIESGQRGASLDLLNAFEEVFNLPSGFITTTYIPRDPRGKSAAA